MPNVGALPFEEIIRPAGEGEINGMGTGDEIFVMGDLDPLKEAQTFADLVRPSVGKRCQAIVLGMLKDEVMFARVGWSPVGNHVLDAAQQ